MTSGFDSLDVHLPATVDVQLVIYLRGAGFLPDGDAFTTRIPTAFVAGPSLLPRLFRVEHGSLFIAATFRPSGFFSCFGIPANLLHNQIVPLDAMIEGGAVASLLEALHVSTNIQRHLILETFLLRQLLLSKGQPTLPSLSLDRLLLPAKELAGTLETSTRQLERRFLIHHGLPLRDYRRLARFSTALASLMQCAPHHVNLSRVAQEARYVDQAHFTRDFRQFVGDTPGRYVKSRMQNESPYQLWQLNPGELAAFID